MPVEFICIGKGSWPERPKRRSCYLRDDGWDDFTFKTAFEVLVVDDDGDSLELGAVKIMKRGVSSGRTELDKTFTELGPDYCSLGQSQNYYDLLHELSFDLQHEILVGLRDCIADPAILAEFQPEQAFGTSLMRSVPVDMLQRFRNALHGQSKLTPFHFVFEAKTAANTLLKIDVRVSQKAVPPTNVHVLIGGNGVGKTRIIGGIERAILKLPPGDGYPLVGKIKFPSDRLETAYFANLVTVAFSAFDRFEPIAEKEARGDVRYSYVGLKKPSDGSLKNQDDLTQEFQKSLRAALSGKRRGQWLRIIEILSSDSILADLGYDQLVGVQESLFKKAVKDFEHLSSGHKIVLLTITRLVELVEDRTLVLMDEPESHLHPPLLGSFIRAISWLLSLRNGVAVIATHSPVVLQEVPRSCVSVVHRTGDFITAFPPKVETFAEDVGILTEEVFKLFSTHSGFHALFASRVNDGDNYDEILEEFDKQIGAEGRAILRALILDRDRGA